MLTVAALLVAVASSACSATAAVSDRMSTVPDTTVTLAIGETADLDGRLRLRVDDVPADSRCPKGEQCVRAGEGEVAISFLEGDRATAHRVCTPGNANTACAGGTCVALVQLDPYPKSGHTIAKDAYRATFEVTR